VLDIRRTVRFFPPFTVAVTVYAFANECTAATAGEVSPREPITADAAITDLKRCEKAVMGHPYFEGTWN